MSVPSKKRALHGLLGLTLSLAAAACTTTSDRSPERRLADAGIADAVQSALLSDPNIYARHIDVRADSGVVHLSGYVWDISDFSEARKVAASVPGVSKVVNEMELERGGRSGGGTGH